MRPIISDIHGYNQMLKQVAKRAQDENWLAPWCLGDIIGIGGSHQGTWNLLQEMNSVCIGGNHDLAVTGKTPRNMFPSRFQMSFQSAAQELGHNPDFKKLAPKLEIAADILLVHATPMDPVWGLATNSDDFTQIFAQYPQYKLILLGHTHTPAWADDRGWCDFNPTPNSPLILEKDRRYILNPGALCEGSYGLLDEHSFTWQKI